MRRGLGAGRRGLWGGGRPPCGEVGSEPRPAGGAVGRRELRRRSGRRLVGAGEAAGPGAMDRNPSPPSSEAEEESDAVGSTVYSKHWLFSILTRLIEVRRVGRGGVRAEARGPGVGSASGLWPGPAEGRCPDRELSSRCDCGIGRCLGFLAVLRRSSRRLLPPAPQLISPEKSEPSGNPEGIQTELDEEMENDICKVWDMSMDEVGAGPWGPSFINLKSCGEELRRGAG